MTVPTDFSLVVGLAPERRLEIERAVEVEHVHAEKAAEKQPRERETVYYHKGLSEQHRCLSLALKLARTF